MIILVTYDITSPKRLQRMFKLMKEYGLHSQKSVFECPVDAAGLSDIRRWCRDNLDLEKDSVRLYRICSRCLAKAEISGRGIRQTRFDYIVV